LRQVIRQKDFLDHSSALFTKIVLDLATAKIKCKLSEENRALEGLDTLLKDTMILSNLIGRQFTYRKAQKVEDRNDRGDRTVLFGEEKTPVFPRMTYQDALDDLLGRNVEVVSDEALAMRRGYIEVQRMYSRGHTFALARSASEKVTSKIQKVLESMIRGRKSPDAYNRQDPAEVIAKMGNWSRAYGEVVYRTNMATAMVQGVKDMAMDPEIDGIIGGFQFSAVGDVDTRHNHQAADGLIAGMHDPIWKRFTPPIGYNCRCTLVMVDKYELKSKGLIKDGKVLRLLPSTFSEAYPDKGFPGLQK